MNASYTQNFFLLLFPELDVLLVYICMAISNRYNMLSPPSYPYSYIIYAFHRFVSGVFSNTDVPQFIRRLRKMYLLVQKPSVE